MKEYNKEKLNEYAKELFALCLEKHLRFNIMGYSFEIFIEKENKLYYSSFNEKPDTTPIWELIEKVKQL